MLKIGITGQSGFVGTHLYNSLKLYPNEFECIPFKDDFFQDQLELRSFVKKCNVIIHLAAINRNSDKQVLYHTNIQLVKQLISSMESEGVNPHVIFSSSTQEDNESEYGKSKKVGRKLFKQWSEQNNASFSGLVVPNVFGPFGSPNYNSFIATFCYKLTHGETPQIFDDQDVKLIYIGSLCQHIIKRINEIHTSESQKIERIEVPYDFEMKVNDILSLLGEFKELYVDKGYIPCLKNVNEVNLFNTFRSYLELSRFYPKELVKNEDSRGIFVETMKSGIGGQFSYSTTVPGITRGNHFHTRKIERFIVIKGKALIQLRKIGTNQIFEYYLDGCIPSYVDMPIWYTHNISNCGSEELVTLFWINEWYNPEDSDTFFEPI